MIKKKKSKLEEKKVGDLIIDRQSMQSRFRDIPWFEALAFQEGNNDAFNIEYLSESGEVLPVTHLRINFVQTIKFQENQSKL